MSWTRESYGQNLSIWREPKCYLGKETADFSCERQGTEYLRLCGPYTFCHIAQLCHYAMKAVFAIYK